MSIATEATPEATPQSVEPVEDAPIIKVSATTAAPKPEADPKGGKPVKTRDWYSGWCGTGPCRDGKFLDANGDPQRHCRGVAENGVKIVPRYLYCACTCHGEEPGAAHPERLA